MSSSLRQDFVERTSKWHYTVKERGDPRLRRKASVPYTHAHKSISARPSSQGRAIGPRSQRSMQAVERSFRGTPVHIRSECP